GAVLKGVNITVVQDGSRSLDPKKYLRDAELLEKNPDCSRSVFYLAISYDMAREERKALTAYRRRAQMGGWNEEVFYSHYRAGCLEEKLGESPIRSFCRAFAARPGRAEPLHLLAKRCNETGSPFLAYLLMQFAVILPFPEDRTFV